MYGRKLRSRLDLMFPKEIEEKETNKNVLVTRNFKGGERVAVRDYLSKITK